MSPTPIFKALRQLESDHIVTRKKGIYGLNSLNPYYQELVKLILKYSARESKLILRPPADRKIDVLAVLKLKAMLGTGPKHLRLCDALVRAQYA